MAKLIDVHGWLSPNSLVAYLHDTPPGSYARVLETVVHGYDFGMIIVGPQGVLLFHRMAGTPRLSDLKWYSDSAIFWREIRRADNTAQQLRAKALQAFLKDYCPGLQVPIKHFLIFPGTGRQASGKHSGVTIEAAPRSLQTWSLVESSRLESELNRFVDQLYLRYYNRR